MAYRAIPPASGGENAAVLSLIRGTVAPFMAARVASLTKLSWWAGCQSLDSGLEKGQTTLTGAAYLLENGAGGFKVRCESGTTASSAQYLRRRQRAALSAATVISIDTANCRTSVYGLWTRIIVNAITATGQLSLLNMTDEATQDNVLGVIGSVSTTNFSYKVGSGSATDTGVAIGTLGATVHDLYWICDGTNMRSYFDGSTTAATTALSNTAANAAGHFQALAANGATAANTGFDVFGVAVFIA